MSDEIDVAALEYHRLPTPGKLEVSPTRNMLNQRDLALTYSPGVGAASRAIAGAYRCTRIKTGYGREGGSV